MKELIFRNPIDCNLRKAKRLSETLFEKIKALGIHLKAIYIKAEGDIDFCALFVAEAEDFLKEEFRNVFILARECKIENENDTFCMSFLFTPDSKYLNEDTLTGDGYINCFRSEYPIH